MTNPERAPGCPKPDRHPPGGSAGAAASQGAEKIHVTDLEAAINWWRERSPSPDGVSAAPEVRALAEAYALLAWHGATTADVDTLSDKALSAWLAWYETTPDSPCIAICSTAQGDPLCKGCGRTFDEVQHWPALDPFEKREVWHRITLEGSAWRFNRYAERVLK